ncbi:hypothetical protein NHX12_028145, partial [Muraenolepis orangiensis]
VIDRPGEVQVIDGPREVQVIDRPGEVQVIDGPREVQVIDRPGEVQVIDGPREVQVIDRPGEVQSGFFETRFQRIFEREALHEPLRAARQQRLLQAKRHLGKAFLPADGTKETCGSGSYYGTLSGPIKAMSSHTIPQKARSSPGRNIYTSPPKKGSGYSYPNVTLSKVELYASDRYERAKELLQREAATNRSKFKSGPFKVHLHPKDYFNHNPYFSNQPLPPAQKPLPATKPFLVPFKPSSPTKQIGGMKAGTFDMYPSHSADPYTPRPKQANPGPRTFWPTPGPKSSPIKSIITLNVNRAVNSTNYTSSIPPILSL